jgi:formate dehydrogenase major subunit
MYLFGEEMSIVDSNANYVCDAFSKPEFFVVQDIFFSVTCKFADVVLPACPSLEREDTFTSTERCIQRLYQVFEPMESSRPDRRNRVSHVDVRRRELSAPGRVQEPPVARSCESSICP